MYAGATAIFPQKTKLAGHIAHVTLHVSGYAYDGPGMTTQTYTPEERCIFVF